MWTIFKWWLCTLSLLVAPLALAQEYTVLSSSSLEIKGASNVHSFACVFEMENMSTENVNYNVLTQTFESAYLQFPVASFDCGGRGINKDFRKLLNEKEHPHLQIRLLHIVPISDKQMEISVEIEIAGEANVYEMQVSYKQEENHLHAEGGLELNIDDFGLEQPKRVLGLIVVRKEIDIHFAIDFV